MRGTRSHTGNMAATAALVAAGVSPAAFFRKRSRAVIDGGPSFSTLIHRAAMIADVDEVAAAMRLAPGMSPKTRRRLEAQIAAKRVALEASAQASPA
jgi:hypothetical protein